MIAYYTKRVNKLIGGNTYGIHSRNKKHDKNIKRKTIITRSKFNG